MSIMNPTELDRLAARIRGKVVELSHKAKTPHLASCLSTIDILVAIYWGGIYSIDPQNINEPNHDRFILSKGHAAMALYATLAAKGFFSQSMLDTYNKDGGLLPEHPSPHSLPGIELGTGSLGHGLPMGLGMAVARKILNQTYRIIVLMSDGECNEGSVWEAALLAPIHKLTHLTVIIDYNKWQATGKSNEIMALAPLKEKWQAFGWNTLEIDGHNIPTLIETLKFVNKEGTNKPTAIIANTIKGKGVSFMEDDNNWHYRVPTELELEKAWRDLKLL